MRSERQYSMSIQEPSEQSADFPITTLKGSPQTLAFGTTKANHRGTTFYKSSRKQDHGGTRHPALLKFGAVVVFAISLIPIHAIGQTSPGHDTARGATNDNAQQAAPNPDSASGNANAEIFQELERMRARIQQLETQLKQQSAGATSASANLSQPAPPELQKVLGASAVSIHADAEQRPATEVKPDKAEPFAFADWTWLNGNPRTKESAMDTKFFTPEIRADVDYIVDFNHPSDDTIGGSSEVFRSSEVQVTQLGVGGDFHYDHVRARLMTQFGLYSQTTPRNDASPARGQWNLADAYRYLSEAYGGYHFNALHGINVDAGIFMSYIGLFSYYNFDNWAYQPSYVSSNTPWFFNGVRVQIFPTEKLKIEPWFINGWQSYGRFNSRPGIGGQILYRPTPWLSVLGNQYGLGQDTLGVPGRSRYHTDDSIEVKYYDRPGRMIDKAAFSLTGDAGCENGGGVSCFGNTRKIVAGKSVIWPKQSFLGLMLYNRLWFDKDRYGF